MIVMSLDDRLDFGRYRLITIREMLETAKLRSYLRWAIDVEAIDLSFAPDAVAATLEQHEVCDQDDDEYIRDYYASF